MAKFTNYHQPYEAAWLHMLKVVDWKQHEPRTIVEIGSYEGSSAWWMLNKMLLNKRSRLYCIDSWDGDGGEERYQTFRQNMAEIEAPERVEIIREWSHRALLGLIQQGVQADLLYIDGGHQAPTVLRDLVLGFELVKTGGLIVCDDYLWDDPRYGGNETLGRPKIAIDAFTTICAAKIKFLRGMPNHQSYFQKTAE